MDDWNVCLFYGVIQQVLLTKVEKMLKRCYGSEQNVAEIKKYWANVGNELLPRFSNVAEMVKCWESVSEIYCNVQCYHFSINMWVNVAATLW